MARTRDLLRSTRIIKRIELVLRSLIDGLVAEHGLTGPQYMALSLLADNPGMSSAQLARRNFVSAQAAGEVVSALLRKGLIERVGSEANRKVLLIHLTDEGRCTLVACDAGLDRLDSRMTTTLTGDEHRVMHAALESCLAALESEVASSGTADPS